jgi:hypothetical protein
MSWICQNVQIPDEYAAKMPLLETAAPFLSPPNVKWLRTAANGMISPFLNNLRWIINAEQTGFQIDSKLISGAKHSFVVTKQTEGNYFTTMSWHKYQKQSEHVAFYCNSRASGYHGLISEMKNQPNARHSQTGLAH